MNFASRRRRENGHHIIYWFTDGYKISGKDLVASSKHADHMQISQMLNFVDVVKIIAEKVANIKIKLYLCIRYNKLNK
jgi:hypothetical protein